EMRVFIFNRWGLIVTEFDGLTEGWDGTYKGEKCKQETYVYLIEYRIKAMPAVMQKKVGTVLLLR
ncbi:MAG: gliding motility-associated C-terminal domain-containing protein, partial [Bacteroidales bacterium]|nr:gliding motility-associated C-terminal domain-containing protein [Bacteroidales bacterium]